MYPQSHLLFPLFIGELLVKLGYVDQRFVLVAVLVGVLVDIDHPIKHFFLTGEINPRKVWNAGIVYHENDRTFIHHVNGMIFVTILFIIASKYFPYWAAAVMVGYYSHMLLDQFSLKKGFIDNMNPKLYWGRWKPYSLVIFGFDMKIARHEIAFDASTEEKFLDSLRKAFSIENKDNLVIGSGFSSLWAFANYMVLPTLVPEYGKLAVKYNL